MAELGTKDNPYKNREELKKSDRYFTGNKAIKEVENRLGRELSAAEKRIIGLEGFVDGYYLDSKGVLTRGVGQTGEFAEGDNSLSGFGKAFQTHVKRAKNLPGMKNFDSYSPELQAELIQAEYRGDLGFSPTFRKLLENATTQEERDAAAKEFLKNEDYIKAKKSGSGVADRMEAVADAVRKEGRTNPFDYFKALEAAEQEEQMINPALFGQRREEERAKGLEQLIDQKLRDSGNTPMMNTEYNQMPMQPQAEGLAALGRGGDSMMVHMQPEEVAGLQQLAMANGSSLTRNPMTGQMEAFNLGGIFKAAIPMAVGAMMPGVGTALAAGALTGGAMAAMSGQDPLMGAISGGMGGYGGFNLGSGLGSFGAGQAGTTAGVNAAKFGGTFGSGAMGAQQAAQAGYAGSLGGMSTAGGAGAAGTLGTDTFNYADLAAPAKMDSIKQGFNAAVDNPQGFLESYGEGSALGGGMKLAGNVGTVASGGVEESDLYPTMSGVKDPRDVYDPNSRLNLSMDTGINEALKKDSGLRLLAEGGYLNGEGDGMSDGISALIDGEQEAALSDGEFVIPADVVSHIGNGSSEAGASKLYGMMDKIRQARTGSTEQAPEIDAERYMPA